MKARVKFGLIALTLTLVVAPASAQPNISRTLELPEATDHPPVIYLGSGVDPKTGQLVEGYAIIHYKDSPAKSPQAGGVKGSNQCYAFLSSGTKWRSVEPWLVNPANIRGLDNNLILNTLAGGINKWEDAADGAVNNVSGADILGNGSITDIALVADTASPDGQNEVYFADISDPGAIAVTIVWGIFSGPPSNRKLVEWDQVYDDFDYDWSTTSEANKMDFDNIATHELGHSVGLADLYDSRCSEQTMFGYATNGETKKRTLEAGDIAGVNKLY